jgi:hypothetical protein
LHPLRAICNSFASLLESLQWHCMTPMIQTDTSLVTLPLYLAASLSSNTPNLCRPQNYCIWCMQNKVAYWWCFPNYCGLWNADHSWEYSSPLCKLLRGMVLH